MCLAIPAKILKIENDSAEVESLGVKKSVNISLVPGVSVGSFVIIHAGFAIQTIDKDEAEITEGYWKQYFSEEVQ
jgi:hydrogenase expression/formation protein HypC